MSTENNKALVRRFYEEVYNKQNLAIIDELIATNFMSHTLDPGGVPTREGDKQFITGFLNTFPDVRVSVEDVIAEGDKVVARWVVRGTHKGEFRGPTGSIPPTGKQVTVTSIDIFRIADGKFIERWPERDRLGLLQQLGVVPAPGQAS
jgi:steroid delta-isomerase-like uncharacterized protein